jgi:uncharacterized protein DUF3850
MEHELDIWPKYFDAVASGDKTFEVREKRNRIFSVGDVLQLSCFDPVLGHDGRVITKRVTYTLDDPAFCKEGYITMGLNY